MYSQKKYDLKDSEHFQWMIVRTQPGEEHKLYALLADHISPSEADSSSTPSSTATASNILEAYNPVKQQNGTSRTTPLFAGYVFVLATHSALSQFLELHYPEGNILYARRTRTSKTSTVWTIPERQMRFFRDFNDNLADKVVVLERPYSDYAYNPKTNQPNATIKVIDGPLKGQIGYLARFRGNRRLVFKMNNPFGTGETTFAIPDIWNFHCVLLHNAENDIASLGTMKQRAADLLIGIMHRLGHVDDAISLLHHIISILSCKPSLGHLAQHLAHSHKDLSLAIANLTHKEAELILYLARYESENPGYTESAYSSVIMRPFLTPTSGPIPPAGEQRATVTHQLFTEHIVPVTFTEPTYYPSLSKEADTPVTYYAHIGVMPTSAGHYTLFANWDEFLGEYFCTAGKANNLLVSGTTRTVAADTMGGGESGEGKTNRVIPQLLTHPPQHPHRPRVARQGHPPAAHRHRHTPCHGHTHRGRQPRGSSPEPCLPHPRSHLPPCMPGDKLHHPPRHLAQIPPQRLAARVSTPVAAVFHCTHPTSPSERWPAQSDTAVENKTKKYLHKSF